MLEGLLFRLPSASFLPCLFLGLSFRALFSSIVTHGSMMTALTSSLKVFRVWVRGKGFQRLSTYLSKKITLLFASARVVNVHVGLNRGWNLVDISPLNHLAWFTQRCIKFTQTDSLFKWKDWLCTMFKPSLFYQSLLASHSCKQNSQPWALRHGVSWVLAGFFFVFSLVTIGYFI